MDNKIIYFKVDIRKPLVGFIIPTYFKTADEAWAFYDEKSVDNCDTYQVDEPERVVIELNTDYRKKGNHE